MGVLLAEKQLIFGTLRDQLQQVEVETGVVAVDGEEKGLDAQLGVAADLYCLNFFFRDVVFD